MRRFSLLPLLAFLLVAGCDTVSEEPVTLSPRDVSFTYVVTFNGAAGTAQATQTATLVGNLDGFQIGEITGARVTAVKLERVSPITKSLGELLASASVRLGSTSVAEGTIPDVSRETMLPATGANVGSEVGKQSFGSTLAFTPEAGTTGTFTFRATLTLSVEVEGL